MIPLDLSISKFNLEQRREFIECLRQRTGLRERIGPKKHLRIRTFSTITKALQANEGQTVSDMIRHLNLANVTQLFDHIIDVTQHHRLHSTVNLTLNKIRVSTWNLNSLSDLGTHKADQKVRIISNLLKRNILCLQETKWNCTQNYLLAERLTNTQILDNSNPSDESSGGTAILVPTYLVGQQQHHEIIVPGYAQQLSITMGDQSYTLLNVYLRPGHEALILQSIHDHWKANPPSIPIILAGDFNQAKKLDLWQDFQAQHAVSPFCGDRETFRTKKHGTCIDGFLISRELEELCLLRPKVHTLVPSTLQDQGHVILTLGWSKLTKQRRPPARPNKDSFSAKFAPALQATAIVDFFQKETSNEEHFTIQAWWASVATASRSKPPIAVLKSKLSGQVTHITISHVQERRLSQELGFPVEGLPSKIGAPSKQLCVVRARQYVNQLLAKQNYHYYAEDNDLLFRKFFKPNDSKRLWEKFRLIVPKFIGALSILRRADGTMTEDPAEMDQLVRIGREFWVEPPADNNFDIELDNYPCGHKKDSRGSATIDSRPIGPPTEAYFLKAILSSADTAPGIDGVPYAYYRLKPAPQAKKLSDRLSAIIDGTQPPPRQLLVWIPKAEAGLSADNWRPLSMPVTWDRLIDHAVYSRILPFFETHLDNSQSLISRFKDPQHNYLRALELMENGTTAKPSFVLLMDLMKAFEKVEVPWVLSVLQRLQVPSWFLKYTTWVLHKDRTSTPRIRSTMLSPINITRGLDMGRACSVLLFCAAIDPYVSRLEALDLKRAYMDDTTLGSYSLEAIRSAQVAFTKLNRTGLQTLRHHCCKIRITLQDSTTRTIASSSWQQAAVEASAVKAQSYEIWLSDWRALSRAALRKLREAEPDPALDKYYVAQCSCKCKTTLIISRPPTSAELRIIDFMPFESGSSIRVM